METKNIMHTMNKPEFLIGEMKQIEHIYPTASPKKKDFLRSLRGILLDGSIVEKQLYELGFLVGANKELERDIEISEILTGLLYDYFEVYKR
jgi:hypothetical protein